MKSATPLLTLGQLFQIRAVSTFDELRCANREIQRLEEERSGAIDAFFARLPPGYSLLPYGDCGNESTFALQRDDEDVAYPLTLAEAHDRAWNHCGLGAPSLTDDPAIAALTRQIEEKRAAASTASRSLDNIRLHTIGTNSPNRSAW